MGVCAAPAVDPVRPRIRGQVAGRVAGAYYVRNTRPMTGIARYKGVPLTELRIEAVRWSEEAIAHIRSRASRKNPGEQSVEPEWATEAALDHRRLVRLGGGENKATRSLVVLGWSPSCERVLKVWIWTDEPSSDLWEGASAAFTKPSTENRYWKEIQ